MNLTEQWIDILLEYTSKEKAEKIKFLRNKLVKDKKKIIMKYGEKKYKEMMRAPVRFN